MTQNNIVPVDIPTRKELPELVILGISETADRLSKFIEHYHLFNIIGYAVNKNYYTTSEFRNKPVWVLEDLDHQIDISEVQVFTGVFWNHLNADRRKLYEITKLLFPSIKFANIISPTAVIRGSIGENNWLMDYVVIQEDAYVSNNCILADYSFVGHKTKVGQHSFIGPKALVGGTCVIGEQTFIGLSSTIFNDTTIGEKCIIGAATAVNRNVPSFSRVNLNCNNQIIKQYSPEEVEDKWVAKRNIR